MGVGVVRVARIVVARNQHLPRRLGRIRPLQDGVDILDAGVLHDAGAGDTRLDEVIALHLKTAATGRRVALKLASRSSRPPR